jgi:bifunctional DNA-binding transcriptional regulator/antitoxin component of YhaV-PrlF toxin-antitoxin module
MQLTLSSKGQIVLPVHMRRSLRLRPRAKLEAEECDGGIFLRPSVRPKKVEPIAYPPPRRDQVHATRLRLGQARRRGHRPRFFMSTCKTPAQWDIVKVRINPNDRDEHPAVVFHNTISQ